MESEKEPTGNRSLDLCCRKVTTESFIEEAKAIYGDRFDYSKVNYINGDHRVTIICPEHGEFLVYAREHLDGKGCPRCEKSHKFLTKLHAKFGDIFGLEQFIYTDSTTPVKLICAKHGVFSRLPNAILGSKHGCPMCSEEIISPIREAAHKRDSEKHAKKEAIEEERRQWLNEFNKACKKIKSEIDCICSTKRFSVPLLAKLYWELIDKRADIIRSNVHWKLSVLESFRLNEEESKDFNCFEDFGISYYRFPGEAPFEDILEDIESYDGNLYEELNIPNLFNERKRNPFTTFLSHKNCSVFFENGDIIIRHDPFDIFYDIQSEGAARENLPITKNSLPESFVSIDFETLYPQRVSACSVGMVKFKEGKLIDRYYSLIRPPFDYPGKKGCVLTWIHGFTEEMLLKERTFDEILPELEKFAEGLPLVAHNASVEKACIRDASQFYGMETVLNYDKIIDTLALSRQIEPKSDLIATGNDSNALDEVCRRFNVMVQNHHNALDDAEMCGNLLLAFRKSLNGERIPEERPQEIPSQANRLHSWKTLPEDKVQRTDLDSIKDNPFKGKNIVLTGFSKADSQSYAHKLQVMGAIVRDQVSGKTNILITGPNAGPSKIQKCKELGAEIISKQTYLDIISSLEC